MRTDGLIAEQLISKARVAIMNDQEWGWISSIIMMGETTFVDADDESMPSAATDGYNERYNRGWIESLSLPQIKFVVLHENFHKMFRHLFVWQGLYKQNPMLANLACDIVINTQYLNGKPNIEFVENGTVIPKYADAKRWNVKDVYDDLLQQMEQQGGGKSTPQGHDAHDWDGAEECTAGEADSIAKEIDAAIRQASLAGSLSAGMPLSVKEMLVPSVDWRTLLSEFVKSSCTGLDKTTWRRPHKTYVAYDLYMPTPYSETMKRILIAGDTSGSTIRVLDVFLGHMSNLVNEVDPSGLDIAWWDTRVAGVDSFERGDMDALASKVKPKGGGGTTPSCIPAWLEKEKKFDDYACAVVITDGEFYGDSVGDWGDLPVLWLVINKDDVPPINVGTVVHVRELL